MLALALASIPAACALPRRDRHKHLATDDALAFARRRGRSRHLAPDFLALLASARLLLAVERLVLAVAAWAYCGMEVEIARHGYGSMLNEYATHIKTLK